MRRLVEETPFEEGARNGPQKANVPTSTAHRPPADLDAVPRAIWDDEGTMNEALGYLEERLPLRDTEEHHEVWLLAKTAMYYFQSTRPDGLMTDLLQFVQAILGARVQLLSLGYPEDDVNYWLKYNEPDVPAAVDWLSKSVGEQCAEYEQHAKEARQAHRSQ